MFRGRLRYGRRHCQKARHAPDGSALATDFRRFATDRVGPGRNRSFPIDSVNGGAAMLTFIMMLLFFASGFFFFNNINTKAHVEDNRLLQGITLLIMLVFLVLFVATALNFRRFVPQQGTPESPASEQSVGGDSGKATDGLTGAPQR